MNIQAFQELLQTKGRQLYRDMPWREDTRPYYILVSELMLQQTQVDRVVPKFKAFIDRFPNVQSLSEAPLRDVLILWNGLGYNRRAKFLHRAAETIMRDFDGAFPDTHDNLVRLPGIGPGTAGAILVYAFNQPVVFIETNVRSVYYYHFFETDDNISDVQLVPLIESTLDRNQPREFYWALMDYGAWLKRNGKGRIMQNRHYKKQSVFQGSIREVRGHIISLLTQGDRTELELRSELAADERFELALSGLIRDELVEQTDRIFHLTK